MEMEEKWKFFANKLILSNKFPFIIVDLAASCRVERQSAGRSIFATCFALVSSMPLPSQIRWMQSIIFLFVLVKRQQILSVLDWHILLDVEPVSELENSTHSLDARVHDITDFL